MINDHAYSVLKTFGGEGRINAALKPVARIRIDFKRTARVSNLHRVPVSAFDKDVNGFIGTAGLEPAHDTGDALHTVVIGNCHLTYGKCVGLIIKGNDLFTAYSAVHPQISRKFISIENVQRAVQIICKPVGHIDQETDRAQANRAQLILQPLRGRTVFDAFNQATTEHRAPI